MSQGLPHLQLWASVVDQWVDARKWPLTESGLQLSQEQGQEQLSSAQLTVLVNVACCCAAVAGELTGALETIFDHGYFQSPWDSLLMDMHDLAHACEGAKSCISMTQGIASDTVSKLHAHNLKPKRLCNTIL